MGTKRVRQYVVSYALYGNVVVRRVKTDKNYTAIRRAIEATGATRIIIDFASDVPELDPFELERQAWNAALAQTEDWAPVLFSGPDNESLSILYLSRPEAWSEHFTDSDAAAVCYDKARRSAHVALQGLRKFWADKQRDA